MRTVFHYFATESDANAARALFIEEGYSCTPVTRSVTGSYTVGVTVTWAHGAV